MSRKLTEAEEERYSRAADWAEGLEGIPAGATVVDATVNQDGRRLMEDLLGSPEAVKAS